MSEAAAKKDIQKLQRAIVDGLEDIKGHDIRVFNTEHLSPLFERVIVASGNSNRQTQALAASVRDKVREAGFAKPRLEGEENGEWIIVDCGPAVAHIMQPAIRQYYNLEEIWGGKPVRLKLAGGQERKAPAQKAVPRPAVTAKAKKAPARKVPAKKLTAGKAPARKAAAKAPAKTAAKTTAGKPRAGAAPGRAPARKTGAGMKRVVVGRPAASRKTSPARKSAARTSR